MVGAIITNKSPVNLTNVTPIARLTSDPMVVVVPKDSPIQSLADLTAKIKSDVGGTVWAGGSAGGADHILAGLITQVVTNLLTNFMSRGLPGLFGLGFTGVPAARAQEPVAKETAAQESLAVPAIVPSEAKT